MRMTNVNEGAISKNAVFLGGRGNSEEEEEEEDPSSRGRERTS